MRYKKILFFGWITFFLINGLQAQVAKFDSTAVLGDVGYHVSCNNKHLDENTITVLPKGFKGGGRSIQFPIKGRLHGIAVDDLNLDGFPDLVIFIYSGINEQFGSVMGISGKDNGSLVPIRFPDIYTEPKLREGYKGHDEFSIVIGLLQQSFPVYKTGDTDTPTGGTRVIQYKVKDEGGNLSFIELRSYEKE